MKKEHKAQGKKEVKEVCYNLCFSGVVQGVGFRYTAAALAARYEIKGWVCNMPGGEVEVLAQGRPAQVASFVRSIQTEFSSNISDLQEQQRPCDRSLRKFEIKFFSSF